MECTVKSMSYENVRTMRHLQVNFCNNTESVHGYLIRNGIGKTTTLDLLRSCLTGVAPGEIESFAYFEGDENNRVYYPERPGEFSVTLEIKTDNAEAAEVTLKMKFDYENGAVNWETDTATKGNDGYWNPPLEYKLLFKNNPGLIKLYMFDGETCDDLLAKTGSNLIEDVVLNATGMKAMRTAYTNLLPAVKKNAYAAANFQQDANTASRVAKLERALIEIEDRIREISSLLTTCGVNLEDKKIELKAVEGEITSTQSAADILQSIKELAGDKSREEIGIATDVKNLRSYLCEPENISESIWNDVKEFCNELEAKKLPGESASFFDDLCKHDNKTCICGTAMTEEMRVYLKKERGSYLGSSVITILNAMKSQVTMHDYDKAGEDIVTSILDHKETIITIMQAETSLNLKVSPAQQKLLDGWRKEKLELESDIDKLSKESLKYRAVTPEEIASVDPQFNPFSYIRPKNTFLKETRAINSTENIPALQAAKKEFVAALARLKGITGFQKVHSLVTAIAMELESRTTDSFNADLVSIANEKVRILHPVSGVSIGKIQEKKILFKRPDGSEQSNVNGALRRVMGYSFIAALGELSSLKMFTYLDSPFQGMDPTVTKPFCQHIAQVFPQSILAIHAGERRELLDVENIAFNPIVIYREDEDPITGKPMGSDEEPIGKVLISYERDFFTTYHSLSVPSANNINN